MISDEIGRSALRMACFGIVGRADPDIRYAERMFRLRLRL